MNRTNVKWLLAAATLATPISALAQTNYPEVEPNDTKAAATAVGGASGMVANDTITGNTTGASTTVTGTTSADYYLITMATAAPGIYKHRLALTTAGTAGHTGSIRGNSQTSAGVYGTDDVTLQSSITTTTPPRFNDFYGFGKGERLYYRVVGTTTTTADYVATLSSTAVTPVALTQASPSLPGTFAIRADAATNTAIDTDLVVLDSNYNFIATRDDPDPSEVSLTLAPGTYYVGISAYNLAVRFPTPTTPTGDFPDPVTDFGDIALMTSTSTNAVARGVEVRSGTTVVANGTGSASSPFDIAWFSFVISAPTVPTNPTISAVAAPALAAPGSSVTITATVNPGLNPDSTFTPPTTGVSADLAAITGVAGTTTFTNTSGNTWTATVTVGASVSGIQNATINVIDDQARTGSTAVTVNIPTNLGTASISGAQPLTGTASLAAGQVAWFSFSTTQPTNATDFFVDVNTLGSLFGTSSDTVAAIYNADGSVRNSADDPYVGSAAAGFSYGDTSPARSYPPYTTTMVGQTGAVLPAGTYFIAVARYAGGWAAGANFNFTSPSVDAGTATVNIYTSLPGNGLGAIANNSARPVFTGESYTLSATVFPSISPPSTLISVQADLSSIGGDNPVSFTEGPTNTFTYTDTLGSVAAGTYLIPFTASDFEGNVFNGNLRLTVGLDAGALVLGTPNVTTQTIGANGVAWFKFTTTDTTGTCRFVDIHTLGSTLAPTNDTFIAIYNADGTVRSTNDDFGATLFSALSYGATAPARTYSPFTTNLAGATGTLPAGVYYAAITSGSATATAAANWVVTSTGPETGTVTFNGIFGAATGAPAGSLSTYLKNEGLQARTRITSCSGPTAIVKVDATAIGGPAAAVIPNASSTTWTGGFAAADSTADGIYTLPFTVEQPEGTVVESGNITVHVRPVTNLGTTDALNSAAPTGLTNTAPATPLGATWFKFTTLEATDASKFVDVATAGTAFTPTSADTVMGVWRPDGTLVAANDDWTGVAFTVSSGLSWGQTAPTRAYTGGAATQDGFDGRTGLTLPAGTYYISINRWFAFAENPVAGADLFAVFTSSTATGTVRAIVGSNLAPSCAAPTVTTPPASLSRLSGQPASFTVVPAGTAPFTYQWKKDGVDISGETSDTLNLAAVTTADNGSYTVTITNACGNITSDGATLTVDSRCSPADVANTDGDPISDGAVDNGDFSAFFGAFFLDEGDPGRLVADIANTDGETFLEGQGPDGAVDNGDFTAFFNYFFQGCPLPLP